MKSIVAAFACVSIFFSAAPVIADSSLDDVMSVINKNMRILGRTPPPPEEGVALVDKCVEAAKKAREMTPSILNGRSAGEKEAGLADYRKRMDEVIAGLGELRAAVAAGDAEATSAALKKLNEMKKSGHEVFMEE